MPLTNNLYPPIMPDVMPAFIRSRTCKIYFGLSKYNNIADIVNVQITLTNTKTNASAFLPTLYPTGVKLATLQYDSAKEGDYCYFVTINPSEIIQQRSAEDPETQPEDIPRFSLNRYYKIQLRFTAIGAESISFQTPQSIATWLSNNTPYFSEWSRGCLVRGISNPTLTINLDTSQAIAPPTKITGGITFAITGQQDYLANYNIKIYLQDTLRTNGLVFDSGILYPDIDAPNEINYDLPYNFLNSTQYDIIITYTTQYLYTATKTYSITISSSSATNPFNLAATATPNNEDGYINLVITMNDRQSEEKFINKLLYIYRTSSKDNYQTFDKINIIDSNFTNITWQDLFVESGIWYKYYLYIINNAEPTTNEDPPIGATLYKPVSSQPVMCLFEDIFLVNGNIQFKLKFDPGVNSFKYMTTESQQTTIGGKFPYIKRNSNNYYRTFGISGLISSLTDETDWYDSSVDTHTANSSLPHIRFLSKQQAYGDSYSSYTIYESQNKISNYLNPLYERLFREAIYNFLYKDEAKLFKSPTEGNILIYLSNITFEPNASLGRILYSFSATATEIDEATFENYIKYHIVDKSFLNSFELMTESPLLNMTRGTNDRLAITINATGGETQSTDHFLRLVNEQVQGGRIV